MKNDRFHEFALTILQTHIQEHLLFYTHIHAILKKALADYLIAWPLIYCAYVEIFITSALYTITDSNIAFSTTHPPDPITQPPQNTPKSGAKDPAHPRILEAVKLGWNTSDCPQYAYV